MSPTDLPKEIHLAVFVHGLWGNPGHLEYLVEQFVKKHNHNVHILNAKNNSSDYTYDGVDVCGDRLVEEINTEVKSLKDRNKQVTKFSIIGYSLGGLVSRYAIGILFQQDFFTSIEPVLFATFATPHLGILREDKTFAKIVKWISTTFLSKTGEQLNFMDNNEGDDPILFTLSRPGKIFFEALSAFKYRKLYANTRNDRTVPFWTAAISDVDPFENFDEDELNIKKNEKFQDIIESIENLPKNTSFTKTAKKVPRYILFVVVIPIILPLWIVLILSTITVQGMLSRRRVQKILATKAKNSNNDNYSHVQIAVKVASMEENVVETAMNIKNFLAPTPGFTTSSKFPEVHLCKAQRETLENLNKLEWEKYAVYLDAFNAHAAIVMRNRLQTKGKDVIRHFVETFAEVAFAEETFV